MIRAIPVLGLPAIALWVLAWLMTANTGYRPPPPPDAGWVANIRGDFAARSLSFGGDGGGLLPGLVLGDTSAIPASLSEAMRTTSLTHLSAVSGSNCAVVVALVFGIAALLRVPLAGRVVASLVALAGFVLLVGPDASVLRSSLMAVVALGGLALGRAVAGVTALSVAVIVALLIEPTLSHSLGFALSVSATLGLLVLARPLTELFERRLPRVVSIALAVPVSASIFCQPIIVVVAPFIPTYGVMANALAEPLVPVVTVLGMLAVASSAIPWLATGLIGIAWSFASVIAGIARIGASLPFARIPWPPSVIGVVLAGAVAAGVVAMMIGRQRRIGTIVGIGAAVLGLALSVGGGAVSWLSAPRDWSWAQCDVGQGDAVVVRDGGRVALIDTGRDEAPIRECLARLAIDRIDLLVLTHFDIDHVGGVGALYGRADTVLHGPTDGIADETILRLLRASGATLVRAERGICGELGRLRWLVEWPTSTRPREPGNPSSIVIRFVPGPGCDTRCIGGVDLGDLPGAEQSILRGLGPVPQSSIVKVSHHGSHDQDPELYRLLHPAVSLVGVGAENDYGHPTSFALEIQGSALVARSDDNGLVLVSRTADGRIAVWRERGSG